ncbi:bifunctional oligoribonuclease/PAP phosphatase NrnA [bacterium]|nr:bifunctional oligoribonuclease/PAP phosphatase NrnA [bacterium]
MKELLEKEKAILREILNVINKNSTFFITSHIHPDGDSFGSSLALAAYLKSKGKKVCVAMVDPTPSMYQFLPGSEKIKTGKKIKGVFDVAFVLDCGSQERTGGIIDFKKQTKIVVNIDHHIKTPLFGDINLVGHKFSSTVEQIYYLLKKAKNRLTFQEAVCIYVGLLTETCKFQESNTSSNVFSIASELLKLGVLPKEISKKIYQNKSFQEQKLLGMVLSTLKLSSVNKIAYLEVNKKIYEKTGVSGQETEGLINYASMIFGVEIAVFFQEQKDFIKVSLRSNGKADVRKIAVFFGGGGHIKAAGCKIYGTLKEAKKQVLDVAQKYVSKN